MYQYYMRSETNYRFCENIKKGALKAIGETCGLRIGDWARSTRWVNLPDIASYANRGVCITSSLRKADCFTGMFFEVPTIWKEKKQKETWVPAAPPRKKRMLKRSHDSGTEPLSKKRTLSNWRPRRIGIFFSENVEQPAQANSNGTISGTGEKPWTCLVLIEPIDSKEEFLFCYRKMVDTPTGPPPNARCLPGERRYTIEETNLQGTIDYIIGLVLKRHFFEDQTSLLPKKCANFITEIGKDVFWGWEEFTTQVVQSSAVLLPSI